MRSVFESNISEVSFAGMINLGNTCYMNSVLQCLLHTPELIEYLVSKEKEIKLSGTPFITKV